MPLCCCCCCLYAVKSTSALLQVFMEVPDLIPHMFSREVTFEHYLILPQGYLSKPGRFPVIPALKSQVKLQCSEPILLKAQKMRLPHVIKCIFVWTEKTCLLQKSHIFLVGMDKNFILSTVQFQSFKNPLVDYNNLDILRPNGILKCGRFSGKFWLFSSLFLKSTKTGRFLFTLKGGVRFDRFFFLL